MAIKTSMILNNEKLGSGFEFSYHRLGHTKNGIDCLQLITLS